MDMNFRDKDTDGLSVLMNRSIDPNKSSNRTLHFKICPLCESLNAKEMRDCWCCGWHGEFDQDPDRISSKLEAIQEVAPNLLEFEAIAPRRSWLKKLIQRIKGDIDTYA